MADNSLEKQFLTQASKLLRVPENKLSASTSFDTDLYTTSLHFYGMMSIVSKLTGKKVTYPQIKACHTIGDVLNLMGSLESPQDSSKQ